MRLLSKKSLLLMSLVAIHVPILFSGLFAPYDVAEQNRDFSFVPPSRIHFTDAHRTLHLRPSVCSLENSGFGQYHENRDRCFPIHFLIMGSPYLLFGVFKSNLHLFGVEAPAKIFLMGTDLYGRDVFSRFLYGGQLSLLTGILATALSLGFGVLFGTLAGYYGGWPDAVIMRIAELFLALPWLYLLFAVRAFLPLNLNAAAAFCLLVSVIGIVGWARPARLVRGIALSSRERHYVLAARLFGGSDSYLIRRHVLPDAYAVIITQAVLLIPQYVLAEVTLSFLGLGVGEPTPSWGNMLSTLQQYQVLVSYWWLAIPGAVLVPVFCSYLLLASELQPRRTAIDA